MTTQFAVDVPDLSALRAGNTGVPGVWQFASGAPGRHVMVTALLHGNELCGAWALKRLLKCLLEAGLRPARGTLTLAFCNLAAFDRFDPQDHDASRFVDEDLNRQWSADRMAEANTLERRRAAELAPWVAAADWLLDLHSMHEPEAPLCLPGPLAENTALALQMGTPAVLVIDEGHNDGVRMRDFAQFGTAAGAQAGARALLVECGFHGDPQSVAVAQDQCVRFLALSGVFEQSALEAAIGHWKLADTRQQVLRVTGKAVARQEGASFVQPWRGLDVVEKAGTVIGHDGAAPITTPHDDCVLVMPSLRQARPGVTMVRFAGRVTAAD